MCEREQESTIRQGQTGPYPFRCLTHYFQVIRRQADVDLQRSLGVHHGIKVLKPQSGLSVILTGTFDTICDENHRPEPLQVFPTCKRPR